MNSDNPDYLTEVLIPEPEWPAGARPLLPHSFYSHIDMELWIYVLWREDEKAYVMKDGNIRLFTRQQLHDFFAVEQEPVGPAYERMLRLAKEQGYKPLREPCTRQEAQDGVVSLETHRARFCPSPRSANEMLVARAKAAQHLSDWIGHLEAAAAPSDFQIALPGDVEKQAWNLISTTVELVVRFPDNALNGNTYKEIGGFRFNVNAGVSKAWAEPGDLGWGWCVLTAPVDQTGYFLTYQGVGIHGLGGNCRPTYSGSTRLFATAKAAWASLKETEGIHGLGDSCWPTYAGSVRLFTTAKAAWSFLRETWAFDTGAGERPKFDAFDVREVPVAADELAYGYLNEDILTSRLNTNKL